MVKSEEMKRNPQDHARKLSAFLKPTMQTDANHQPTLNAHYRRTYNYVDCFDAMMGHLPVNFKVVKPSLRILLGALGTAVVNAYVLFGDLEQQRTGSRFSESLRDFSRTIAQEMEAE